MNCLWRNKCYEKDFNITGLSGNTPDILAKAMHGMIPVRWLLNGETAGRTVYDHT